MDKALEGTNGVSVVIPVYRGAQLLRRAVESALAQPETVQVIVINDGSPEDVDTAMAELSDPRILYLVNDQNQGVAYSRNRGVAAAQGAYVAFLDADDMWEPGKLRAQLEALEATGAVLCCTGRAHMTPQGELTGRIIGVPQRISYRELLRHNCIVCSSVVMRRQVAQAFPMEHDRGCHEDYVLWLRILEQLGPACGVDRPLVRYSVSQTGKSGSKLQSAIMTYRVYRVLGFSLVKSLWCFGSYALHGLKKHYL